MEAIYYQWETLVGEDEGVIQTSEFMTKSFAEDMDYTESNGWYIIESSKRKWDHYCRDNPERD